MIRRAGAVVGLAVVVAVALALAARPAGHPDSPAARAYRIAAELRCPVCQGLSVADSPSETSRDMRADIRRRIDAGETDSAIRQVYVDRYGQWILLRPRGTGFAAGLWVVPVTAITLAAVGLGLRLRRWRRQPALAATADDHALVDAMRRAGSQEPPR